MGDIGHGYGSEWHLMRILARHREQFSDQLSRVLHKKLSHVEPPRWLDSPYKANSRFLDGEIKAVDFLPDHGGSAWKNYWPDSRAGVPNRDGVPSWDAVGKSGHDD